MISANLIKVVKRDKYLLLLIFLPTVYFVIFCYIPMAGIVLAFQDFLPGKGVFGSEWVGFKWFGYFFNSYYFFRLLRNTFLLSIIPLIFGFPIPIIFAISINEIKNMIFKRTVQTASYLPYFISMVVVVGMVVNFLSPNDGIINILLNKIGIEKINFLGEPKYFRFIYTSTVIWQSFGFSSIIYIAAIVSIDQELYTAARIDGASKFQQVWHITIPGLMPTISILFILSMGGILSVGFERVFLMYNPGIYVTADVISTFVYRTGIESMNYSYASAVGLFNSVINLFVLIIFNTMSRKMNSTSIW